MKNILTNSEQLLSSKQSAELLGVKTETLTHWRCVGRYDLPYIKIGRLVKYKKSDLENFIAQNRKGGENE